MKPRAKIKSLKNADILATIFRTKPGDPLARPFSELEVNLTAAGVHLERVCLRIAEVDDAGPFPVAVDDFRLSAQG